jgi:hypothetical protein
MILPIISGADENLLANISAVGASSAPRGSSQNCDIAHSIQPESFAEGVLGVFANPAPGPGASGLRRPGRVRWRSSRRGERLRRALADGTGREN